MKAESGMREKAEASCIIIMEICKAPTLRLKALNKRSITHIMDLEMENVISSNDNRRS